MKLIIALKNKKKFFCKKPLNFIIVELLLVKFNYHHFFNYVIMNQPIDSD